MSAPSTCRVRILKVWESYRVGDEIPELPRSSAELLVARGVAEYVGAVAAPAGDRAVRGRVDRMARGRVTKA